METTNPKVLPIILGIGGNNRRYVEVADNGWQLAGDCTRLFAIVRDCTRL